MIESVFMILIIISATNIFTWWLSNKKNSKILNDLSENIVIDDNADVANLLMNGIEGKEYQKVSDHIIDFLPGKSAGDLGYSRTFTMFGDYCKVFEWSPVTEDDYLTLQKYYSSTPSVSPLFGYVFDPKVVSSELSTVSEVLTMYLPALECGLMEDVPAAVAYLNEKLDEAKAERYSADVWKIVNDNVNYSFCLFLFFIIVFFFYKIFF